MSNIGRYRNPHTLMVQGTTSDAGKTVMVAAICRILARQGVKVAPFKSQNMALNSAVTPDGGEIGRAQAVQAEACYIQPDVRMNPILIKPNTDIGAQVIVRGKSIGNLEADQYHTYKTELLQDVVNAHNELREEYDVVIVEGAGSPAEINLRDRDLANMGFAEAVDCPVIIVADIDRGGVFAHLYGTLKLLSESEQNRVEGFIINRFRGDIKLLQGGLDWLEEKTGKPVLAVVPYIHNLHIEAEDAVSVQQLGNHQDQLKVFVPVYPRASNHTDFDALRMHPQVDCQLSRDTHEFNGADLIILPGSKNTRNDLAWLKQHGWDKIIKRHLRLGGKVMGICGGYQMLGNWVHDPQGCESAPGSCQGLGLLDIETILEGEKQLRNVRGQWLDTDKPNASQVTGYEIHVGSTTGNDTSRPLVQLDDDFGQRYDGARNDDNSVIGSYVHGILDESSVLNAILGWAGLAAVEPFDYQAHRASEMDRLADVTETALPLSKLMQLINKAD